jgi:uncharacterized repeat protein (TIGR04138 family)
MQAPKFEDVLEQILAQDPRYSREAYFFVREALDFTQKLAIKGGREQVRHVTGQELLDGIREFALQQYGPMTALLLGEWGLTRCEDFGELVFNMVEAGLLAKTKKDSREDFKGGYDFDEAFRRPFLPTRRSAPPESQPVRSGNA